MLRTSPIKEVPTNASHAPRVGQGGVRAEHLTPSIVNISAKDSTAEGNMDLYSRDAHNKTSGPTK